MRDTTKKIAPATLGPPLVPLHDARAQLDLPVAVSTVIRWAREGVIPATKIGGRYYIDPEVLRAAVVRP